MVQVMNFITLAKLSSVGRTFLKNLKFLGGGCYLKSNVQYITEPKTDAIFAFKIMVSTYLSTGI